MNTINIRKITTLGLLTAIALTIFMVEAQIPALVPVPGVKLGAANIVCLYALYSFSPYEAFGVHLGRIVLSGILFGSPISLVYSLTGGILAFCTMLALSKIRLFSPVGVSVGGSVMHSVGQLLAASVIMGSAAVFTYLPFMLIWSLLFGAVTGSICLVVLKRTKKLKKGIDKGV